MDNLWGDLNFEKVETPANILLKQAEFLKQSTNGIVYAEVRRDFYTEKVMGSDKLVYNFSIKGRDLPDYSYNVLSITNPIEIYPTELNLESSISTEIDQIFGESFHTKNGRNIYIDNEKEFIDILKIIFQTKRIRRIIVGVISLSQDEVDNSSIPF